MAVLGSHRSTVEARAIRLQGNQPRHQGSELIRVRHFNEHETVKDAETTETTCLPTMTSATTRPAYMY